MKEDCPPRAMAPNPSPTRHLRMWKLAFRGLATILGGLGLGTAILIAAGLQDQMGRADIGLVLGNKVELDGTPSARLRARLDRTLDLYRDGYFPTIIVSGGIDKNGRDEATVMKDYLVAHGVPVGAIIVDRGGATTFSSARNASQIIHLKNLNSILIVSQYFHIPRARLALSRFGVPTVYSAHAHYFEFRDLYSCPREAAGYLRYWFRSYDLPDGHRA